MARTCRFDAPGMNVTSFATGNCSNIARGTGVTHLRSRLFGSFKRETPAHPGKASVFSARGRDRCLVSVQNAEHNKCEDRKKEGRQDIGVGAGRGISRRGSVGGAALTSLAFAAQTVSAVKSEW
eukprot:1178488-Prorocentrum_minimum.AAC.2